MSLRIKQIMTQDAWDRYILHHERSGYCHLFNWKKVIMDAYNHDSIYLAATNRGESVETQDLASLRATSQFVPLRLSCNQHGRSGVFPPGHNVSSIMPL